jgi:hypothetical protein
MRPRGAKIASMRAAPRVPQRRPNAFFAACRFMKALPM